MPETIIGLMVGFFFGSLFGVILVCVVLWKALLQLAEIGRRLKESQLRS